MKRALVIGASGALGSAVVEKLLDAGYEVDTTYNRNLPRRVERQCQGRIGQQERCDLSSADDRGALFAALGTADKPYYAVIHCAGITYDALAFSMNVKKAHDVMEVNFWSFVDLCRAVLPGMLRAREGRIVAVSSIAAGWARKGNGTYAATKAALGGYIRAAALECAGRGVSINELQPGYIATPMLDAYASQHDKLRADIPAGRFGKPEEVANAVEFLLQPQSAYICGASLVLDGGLSIGGL